MSDDDSTQEFKPDDDRYKPSNSPETQAFSSDDADAKDDTPPFGRRPTTPPPAQEAGNATQQYARPARESYQSSPSAAGPRATQAYSRPDPVAREGYRPAPSYSQPMLPTDRGSSGFPAALVGAVVAALVAVAASYASYEVFRNNTHVSQSGVPGFFIYRLQLMPWVQLHGSNVVAAFVAGAVIVLVVTLLLMMASTLTTRAGNGGFSVFLAGWMASVIAAAIARTVASAIVSHDLRRPDGAWQLDISNGVIWGLLYGWIAAVVLLIMHVARRKPVG